MRGFLLLTVVISFLTVCFQDVCKIVVNYCHILKDRVRVLSENCDPGSAINMVSTLARRKDFSIIISNAA